MERIMTALVNRIMIPILPFFVGLSFLGLAYEGSLSRHLPVFIMMVLIVIVGHFIWLAVLYGIGGALSGRNPSQVFRHYAPAYLTAVGHHVQRRHPARGPGMRPQVLRPQPHHGGIHGAPWAPPCICAVPC